MKKRNLLLSLCLLTCMAVCANPYDHSLGVSMGGFNGLSYKLWKNNFAFQMDVGTRVSVGTGSGDFYRSSTYYVGYDWLNLTLEAIPTFLFQKSVFSNRICDIAPYFGAGVSLGYLSPRGYLAKQNVNNTTAYLAAEEGMGKFGIHTAMGLEFAFAKCLSLSFDFKPGYGLGFGGVDGEYTYISKYTTRERYYDSYSRSYKYRDVEHSETRKDWAYSFGLLHYFDWSLSMALRFYI